MSGKVVVCALGIFKIKEIKNLTVSEINNLFEKLGRSVIIPLQKVECPIKGQIDIEICKSCVLFVSIANKSNIPDSDLAEAGEKLLRLIKVVDKIRKNAKKKFKGRG